VSAVQFRPQPPLHFLEHDRLHPKPPDHIQAVTFCHIPDAFHDSHYADSVATITSRKKTRQQFHVDHMPVLLSWSPDLMLARTNHWQGMMSHQASSDLWVGFLKVDLNTALEDAAPRQRLSDSG
jgi:hypothetical protein